jgi:hypothetical protein
MCESLGGRCKDIGGLVSCHPIQVHPAEEIWSPGVSIPASVRRASGFCKRIVCYVPIAASSWAVAHMPTEIVGIVCHGSDGEGDESAKISIICTRAAKSISRKNSINAQTHSHNELTSMTRNIMLMMPPRS